MKIVIDARFYGLENAGLGRYSINLLDSIAKLDQKNSYFVLLRKKYFDQLSLPQNFTKVLADFGHYSFSEQLVLPRLISKISPDLIHFLHFNVPLFTFSPFVVTIHDMIMHKSKGMETTTLSILGYYLKRIAYKVVFWFAVSRAVKIITPSQAVRDELVSYFGVDSKKIAVTPLGLEQSFLDKPKKKYSDKDYFVYVGNAYPHKNLYFLIDAASALKKKLIIVTPKNTFSQKLAHYIARSGAKSVVSIQNFIDDTALSSLLSESTAFVYPSLIEGFGFQGLEALASRTLLVCSDIPVFREVYKDCAFYFSPDDSFSLKEKLVMVSRLSPLEREEMIKKGYLHASQFSWESTAKLTLKIYESAK